MDCYRQNRLLTILVFVWYLGGIAGFMIPSLMSVFQELTPIGMIMAVALLMYFHEPKNRKSWLVFSGIVVISFIVELIGVNTRLLFGNYEYGPALGLKIWNTPLVIGFNWLVLIYCISALMKKVRDHWYFPLIGALAMVAFDWIMEPGAIATGMWSWADASVPVKNYIDWFLVSGFLFLMVRILKVEFNNRFATLVLSLQFVFFLIINLLIR